MLSVFADGGAFFARVGKTLTVSSTISSMSNGQFDREGLRPTPPEETPRSGGWTSIVLAGVVGLALAGAMFLLILQFAAPLAIVGTLVVVVGGLIALFHYVVWGWWLSNTIREEVEAEERRKAEDQQRRDI